MSKIVAINFLFKFQCFYLLASNCIFIIPQILIFVKFSSNVFFSSAKIFFIQISMFFRCSCGINIFYLEKNFLSQSSNIFYHASQLHFYYSINFNFCQILISLNFNSNVKSHEYPFFI